MNTWFQRSITWQKSLGREIIKEFTKIEDFGNPLPFGFVYIITNLETDKFYIGKKQLISNTNKRLGKKERAALPVTKGRKPTKKKITRESNWKNYWGSSLDLQKDLNTQGSEKFEREILHICPTKKQLTYYEVVEQIHNRVLMVDSYNSTILGCYYRKDFLIE